VLQYVTTDDDARQHLAQSGAGLIVAIPVFNARDDSLRCLRSVLVNTDPGVPILVVDDGSSDRITNADLQAITTPDEHQERLLVFLAKPTNRGFVDSANRIFDITGRADVALVNSDVEVGEQWLARLREAVLSTNLIASASALSNHGGILSVPNRNEPDAKLPDGLDLRGAAERVRRWAPGTRPRIPTAVGHCVYLRRIALDVVGPFDIAFAPGYEEEVDWSQRALAMGFQHVVADDVYVFHRSGGSFGFSTALQEHKTKNQRLVIERYPYYPAEVRNVEDDATSMLAASLLAARRSLQGLTVIVDGMCLGSHQTGTQTVVVNLTRALSTQQQISRIELLVPGVLPDYAAAALADADKVVVVPSVVGTRTDQGAADVVLRPYQFASEIEVEWLRTKAERLVVVQLDLIAFNNPAYFPSYGRWLAYRSLQALALMVADGVGFISDTVKREATTMGLLPSEVPNCIMHLGIDESANSPETKPSPGRWPAIADGFLLLLGASFLHKNRVWSVRLVEQLLAEGWSGQLVLAGPTPSYGSSRALESAYLDAHPTVREHVVDLGPVSSGEKQWLYHHSALVLYPTLNEGFGLIPFEAAAHGIPCLSTRQGSLDEVLPRDLITLDSMQLAAGSGLVRRILADNSLRSSMVNSLRSKSSGFSWEHAAAVMTDVMWTATSRPRRNVAAIETARGRLTLRARPPDRWLRRVIDPIAAAARGSRQVQQVFLPGGTKRGDFSRRVYHRIAGDERPHRRPRR
jgi:GT2 family glycosyltransferase/glycosyltransferase involved in cell wall biosynthesis